jgi:hypothetical protein
MIKIRYLFYCLAVLVGVNIQALSEDEVDFIKAQPTTKFQVSSEESVKTKLNPSESAKSIVWIVKKNGEYFWKSRENQKLDHVVGGMYHKFTDPQGGGYVKIEQGLDGEIKFLEHVGIGLTTFTYFGDVKSFNP